MLLSTALKQAIITDVQLALEEDIGEGDISAALIDNRHSLKASVITRDDATIAGTHWVDEVFRQLDPSVNIHWHVEDGTRVAAGDNLFELEGAARSLLTGERTALNFLQTLSAVATRTRDLVTRLEGTKTTLLDTRKTLPGLRLAQKYAVTCGGGSNHRTGLYDAFLIKENHILACGSITLAIEAARKLAADKTCEVEVENFEELQEALSAAADIIMLDNFSDEDKRRAVAWRNSRYPDIKLEASGNITEANLRQVAETGVDYISVGSLTKDIKAIDLSMRIVEP